jgi:hypothetical protein
MGTVSDYLHGLLARQVREQGVVVWDDPEGHYLEFVRTLQLPETRVARYEGSFYSLRRAIEPLLGGFAPPRLVGYVPLDPAATGSALAEEAALGGALKPKKQPPARDAYCARGAGGIALGMS